MSSSEAVSLTILASDTVCRSVTYSVNYVSRTFDSRQPVSETMPEGVDCAARIDFNLWMNCLTVKELDGGTTSINALLNEGLKLARDRKMQEITAQRQQRNTLQSMTVL